MTATNLNRKTEKRKTMEMKQVRKHKWHFQEAWMHVDEIKRHLDSMKGIGKTRSNRVLLHQ